MLMDFDLKLVSVKLAGLALALPTFNFVFCCIVSGLAGEQGMTGAVVRSLAAELVEAFSYLEVLRLLLLLPHAGAHFDESILI